MQEIMVYYLRGDHNISQGINILENIFTGFLYLILWFILIMIIVVYIISMGFKEMLIERINWINKISKKYKQETRERINSGPDDDISPEYYENIMAQDIKKQVVNKNKSMFKRINSSNNINSNGDI